MNKLSLIKPFIKTNVFDKCVISSITDDSRDVQKNSLFVARQGIASHGKDFVKDAVRRGASCIISDQNFEDRIEIPIYCLNNLEDQILEILFRFHELSVDNFVFHGVTGTNGKTTTAFMAHNIIRGLERPSIYIGTLGAFINDDLIQTKGNTTPGIFEILQILQASKAKQKTYVFLEISSHALEQKRLGSLPFFQTILLNIQSDHLDYHKTYKNYIDAKLSITELNNKHPTIIFFDKIQDLLESLSSSQKKQLSTSTFLSANNSSAMFKYSVNYKTHEPSKINLDFPRITLSIYCSLFLKFNIENYISAIALISKHISSTNLNALNNTSIKLPQGRGELLKLKQGKILIDFAHDHLSIFNILSELANSYNEIIVVFGCGGDRDKSKRPKMMRVVQDFASKIFFTSDNNRYESFSSIASDAMQGNDHSGAEIIEDRQEAIRSALPHLNNENILVILGKGHETDIEILGKKVPFNDKDCVLKIMGDEIN
ncbi:UDP-N-acetylmuramyl-tripeptide synthetase [Pseudomonadota bacterium]|nr:UDP-N-acetylmuramyl-tripeptide synthetase [Pseudomonadota bacterium]